MTAPTQIEIAQMATFIDAEGSIVLSNRGDSSFSVRVQISNTDARLMLWLKARFGGSFLNKRGVDVA